ncbi:MAG: response regulator transcription factor [Ruminiclostridium sp.]|jgi:two-component system response regulator protein BraR/BceR|nr:response regulator transcription factor [Ruminiclostridium sp.]MCI9465700.1 response regulator transcription factor [Ruminiclostridium sp.]
MYRILVVEDDFSMAQVLQQELTRWGYGVRLVEDFQAVIPSFVDYDPHLVLLDIMLPFYNGYHWCSEIRKLSNVPVVFLSSASDNMNIVMAMNMGGDDFLPKPVDLAVLTAKLQAILRRSYDLSGQVPVMEHRGVVLNLNDASLRYQDQRLELSKNEFRILQTLLEHKGKVVSRDTLMTKLWQMDCYVEENTLTVNVARLRKKLEGVGLRDFIRTRVGAGYIVE